MRLIGDIGGTNARFALIEETDAPPRGVRRLACADHPSVTDAIRAYLADPADLPPDPPVDRAVLAVASPVTGDAVAMTNHVWAFSIRETEQALGLDRLTVVNDFEALAHALPVLGPGDTMALGGPEKATRDRLPHAVIGPGTGLGMAALVPVGDTGWQALPTEGGHASLAAAGSEQAAIIEKLRVRYGRVSAERAISGPGLAALFDALGGGERDLSPEDVTARLGADPIADQAVQVFATFLGAVAGDYVLQTGARGGLFIAGGIVPDLAGRGVFPIDAFRTAFEDKGRFRDYLAPVPTRLITRDLPAFAGLAALAG